LLNNLNLHCFRIKVRLISSSHDLLLSGLVPVVFYVVTNSLVKKNWFLTDHSEARPQVVNVVVLNVNVINDDLSSLWIIESLQQLLNGWFSTTRRTHKSYFMACLNLQAHVLKDILISCFILESYVANLNVS
jgi:hypothetical protein